MPKVSANEGDKWDAILTMSYQIDWMDNKLAVPDFWVQESGGQQWRGSNFGLCKL